MITTIQVHAQMKEELNQFRTSTRESYEDIIRNILTQVKKTEMSQSELLKQGYQEMAQLSNKVSEEFAHVDAENLPDY